MKTPKKAYQAAPWRKCWRTVTQYTLIDRETKCNVEIFEEDNRNEHILLTKEGENPKMNGS